MSGKWDKWYYYKPLPKDEPKSHTDALLDVLGSIFLLCFVCAIGVTGWQVYAWLKIGKWHPLSVMSVLKWLDLEWARNPSDWIGVHKMLDGVPLLLALLVLGVTPLGLWSWLDERISAKK